MEFYDIIDIYQYLLKEIYMKKSLLKESQGDTAVKQQLRQIQQDITTLFTQKEVPSKTIGDFNEAVGQYTTSLMFKERHAKVLKDTIDNLKAVLTSVKAMDDEHFNYFKKILVRRLSHMRQDYFVDQTIDVDQYTTFRRRMFRVMFAQLGKNKKI